MVTEQKVSTERVDARGKPCPMPVLLLAQALRRSERVELLADDPAAEADVEAFAAATGARLEGKERRDGVLQVVVIR